VKPSNQIAAVFFDINKHKINKPMTNNFNSEIAVELASLINAAYEQFDFATEKKAWPIANTEDPDHSKTFKTDDGKEYQLILEYKTKSPYNKKIQLLNEDVPFGFIATRNENIFVVFRGTRTPLEWVHNGEIKQVPYLKDFGSTTCGFNRIYREFSEDIINTLKDDKFPREYKVFVTGHSLGGALASLCVIDIFQKTSFKNPVLYTFASPRVGDKKFAQAFKEAKLECFRIANTEDIVPTLPLSTPTLEEQPLGLADELISVSLKTTIGLITNYEIFEHIGRPVYFTTQKDTIADNHNLQSTYVDFLKSFDDIN